MSATMAAFKLTAYRFDLLPKLWHVLGVIGRRDGVQGNRYLQ
jgi:hypothetical protein